MEIDDTDFRVSRHHLGCGAVLPPIVIAVASGPWNLQTYWTAEEARGFAAELMAAAEATTR